MATFVMDCALVVQGVVVQLVDSAIRLTNPRKNNMGVVYLIPSKRL